MIALISLALLSVGTKFAAEDRPGFNERTPIR
jgi:hypothetical protein